MGTTIGDYQIVSVIGRGGMGKVFKVRNVLSDRVEAMKVLLPELDPRPDQVERFLREIKVVAGLEHPGIAALRTALRVDTQILMIMEYVEGNSLQHFLGRGRIEVAPAVHLTKQLLEALSYAHQRGVVHRDVKPSNILIGPGGQMKLTDFGIASRHGDPKLTAAGTAVGSLHYMSPEQMRAEPIDARSDLYSVGVTLYEMVIGQTPVQGDSFYSILRAHLEEKPRPAVELVPGITPELSQIIDRSLEKMPEARFQNADEFHTALSDLDAGSREAAAATAIMAGRAVSDTPIPADLRTTNASGRTESTPLPGRVPTETGSKVWDPAVLENVRKNLAVYVGPMAKVFVSRAAKNARALEDMYQVLALEISSPPDREKFLAPSSAELPLRLRLQHADGLHQTEVHSVEGLGQLRNLVGPLDLKFGNTQIALADLICGFGKARDWTNHNQHNGQVQQKQRRQRNSYERKHQAAKSAIRNAQWHRHRDRDDLRTDRVAHFPVKSIVLAVNPDQRHRSLPPSVVTLKARASRHDRRGQKQSPP